MYTYEDFDSRAEFVKHLNLYHNNPWANQQDFIECKEFCQGFDDDLAHIKNSLESIKQNWHNQSLEQIEQSVAVKGQLQLDIMAGQKHDKIKAGYNANAPQYRVNPCLPNSVFNTVAEDLGLINAFARYHVQFPGEVTVFHTDIFSPAHEFLPSLDTTDKTVVGRDNGIRRVLISLEDWNWGHVMMFGTSVWKQWKAGTLIYWHYGVPHCAANMGFEPRISVSITGQVTQQFYDRLQIKSTVNSTLE